MSNTIKTLVFIVSFFTFLIVISLFNSIIFSLFFNSQLLVYGLSSLGFFAYIIALLSQALVRHIYCKKNLENSNVIFAVKCGNIRSVDRVLIFLLPAMGVVFPIVRDRSLSTGGIANIVMLVILAVIIEILIPISKNTMKAVITDKGIGIKGFDIRIDLPVNANYPNGSGFYPYKRIHSFLIVNNEAFIEHSYDYSIINFKCDSEQARQLKGILLKNGVEEKRGY